MKLTQEPKPKLPQPLVANHIPSITPLKGIAALCIVACHYLGLIKLAQPKYDLQPKFLELLMDKGYLWVDLFFIVSGLVIFHVYHIRFSQGVNKDNYRQFLIARFARVYPLHLFTLLFLLALQLPIYLVEPQYAFSERYFPLIGIITNITLMGSFGNLPYGWNDISWAVGAEWYTYMIFPFLLPLFLRNSSLRILLNCLMPIFLLFGLSKLSVASPNTLRLFKDYGFVRCLLDFILGIGIYQAYQKSWLRRILSRNYVFLLAWVWIITVILTGGHDAWTIPGFALLVISGVLNRGKVSRILNMKELIFLGKISYSIYLIHGVFMILTPFAGYIFCGELFCSGWTQLELYLGFFSFTAITIIFSILAYYGIEVRARKFLLKKLL